MDVHNPTVAELSDEIRRLKQERGAIILAHYYQRPEVQDVADRVDDSLALAKMAREAGEQVIVLCGVGFMAETAKILCPEKRVLCPVPDAGCSLADGCNAAELEAYILEHPGMTVVSYVNTTAAVKALSDLCVTSGNARRIIDSLPEDERILFVPDRNLGNWINTNTGREMTLWDGACHVHEQFSVEKIARLRREHPGAPLLVHPECTAALRAMADVVGSTAVLLKHVTESPEPEFIVATESGIIHKMRQACPDKRFIPGPPNTGECACNECAFMKMITLESLRDTLRDLSPEITVEPELADAARQPIERMLELS